MTAQDPGAPPDPREGAWAITVPGDGIRLAGLRWGPTAAGPGTGRMAVLLHGVQSAAVTMARIGRALASDGWNAIALDLPGHGGTTWLDGLEDRERYARANVARLVGEAVRALGSRPVLIGHSWGADIALAIAVSGAPLDRVVLIDPPVMTALAAELAAEDVAELRPGDLEAARSVVAAGGRWMTDPVDAEAKAQALTTIASSSIEAVYLGKGYWQPGVDARRWRAMPDAPPLDLIAADPDFGGLIPSAALDDLRSILGADRVHFLEGASHSPQRTDFDRLWTLLGSIVG
jgi:pimeloyl-ACP methyl ester carboxylesterase